MVDFVFAIIDIFSLSIMAEALQKYVKVSVFYMVGYTLNANFRWNESDVASQPLLVSEN